VEFRKAKPVSLRGNPLFSEKWLQGLIAEDPSLLGLGDLVLMQAERRQPRAGRLDLLLVDPEEPTRYEVEIQLGPTDEAHIIRTIEYWDGTIRPYNKSAKNEMAGQRDVPLIPELLTDLRPHLLSAEPEVRRGCDQRRRRRCRQPDSRPTRFGRDSHH
jgi:hypothetical protein